MRIRIVAAGIVVLSSVVPAGTPPEGNGVGGADVLIGNTGNGVYVGGSKTSPGQGGNHSNGANRGGIQETIYIPPPRRTELQCAATWQWSPFCFEGRTDAEKVDEVVKALQEMPPITITDLASFSPAVGILSGEPDNLGVVGLPTNFVADASTHTRSGSLFGFPIEVRFTPTSYTFHYGDGESRASESAGASWSSLSQAQFTPTATSHTYSERGTYDARVDLAYTAEIDLGTGWFPVSGTLTITGATQSIRIYEAHTALVARTCAEQPAAPGC